MSTKKFFNVVDTNKFSGGSTRPGFGHTEAGFKNYQSTLPEVYSGHPNRVERYSQYETMDADSEINTALDILAEFSTQTTSENKIPFSFYFKESPSETEVLVLKEALNNWTSLNQFSRRVFRIFRNAIKYGDQVFIRDPETFQWHWVDNTNVVKVIVNESKGKEPEFYIIKNLNVNFQNLTATQPQLANIGTGTINNPSTGMKSNSQNLNTPGSTGTRFQNAENETVVDADHIVHISMTEGLDPNWPFGVSVLESVFKVFKQKELLEDAIIIYRVQRAPERRVFYIDTGSMPTHMAMTYVNQIKNEVHQRRIPTQDGGSNNVMDATYNPLSTNEDYFFAQTSEGRGSKVDTLPGGTNLSEIDDLKFFTNKLFRGLRIPSSYLPTGSEDGSAILSDGRLGTALIQELRFNQYCKRLQINVSEMFDKEFKLYLRKKGHAGVDMSLFELRFNEPQNFASYRQAEVDQARVSLFSGLAGYPFLSKRFMLQRFLGLTEDEMAENERLWAEEAGETTIQEAMKKELRSVGVTPGGLKSDSDEIDSAPKRPGRRGGGGGGRRPPPSGPPPGGPGGPPPKSPEGALEPGGGAGPSLDGPPGGAPGGGGGISPNDLKL